MSFLPMSAGTTAALRGAGGEDVGEECGADGGGAWVLGIDKPAWPKTSCSTGVYAVPPAPMSFTGF